MPTYQYKCSACEHSFEIYQSMIDKKLRKCPGCGQNKLTRLIGSGGGIIFKGSGFYETDYKQGGPAKVPAEPSKKMQEACHSCPKAESCSSSSAE